MNSNDKYKKEKEDFLISIYDYVVSENQNKPDFLKFIHNAINEKDNNLDEIFKNDDTLTLDNLIILVNSSEVSYKQKHKSNLELEQKLLNIKLSLHEINFMRVFVLHLKANLSEDERESHFYNLVYNDADSLHFRNFITSSTKADLDSVKDFFVTRNLSNFTGVFRPYYDFYYEHCENALKWEETPVLNLKSTKTDIKPLPEKDNLIFNFDGINDSFYLLKKIISSSSSKLVHTDTTKSHLADIFISEDQFYNAIQRLDFITMLETDYKQLFRMSLSYPENRSLSYLLSMAIDKFKVFYFLEMILHKNKVNTENLNISSKFELFVDYLGIEMFYSHLSSFNYPVCSAFEVICYYEQYEFIGILLKKGLDVSKVPDIDNFLNFSSWTSPLKAIPIFNSVKDYVINNPDVLYNFCDSVLYNKDNTHIDLLHFLKTLNINIFEVKNKDDQFLVHGMFNRLDKSLLMPILNYMFEYKSESVEWMYTNDKTGNNFTHLCIYLSGFMEVSPFLVKNRSMLELFFEQDLKGRRPVDYVLQCEPDILDIMVNLLKIIIPEHDDLYLHAKSILDSNKDLLMDDDEFRALINTYTDPCMQTLLIELDKNYPIVKDYIMYDVYTDEKINEFEKYIKEMLDAENNVMNWVPKLREKSGSKKLAFTTKIKKNLSQLRETFPNFKEFIDHVDNNIHLNDMGSGYFWIPPSLLVSAPGIGKTFFLHCLAKAVGVTYDMISMESVTAGFVLVGSNQQWRGGQPGAIFHKVFNSEYANNILILDEVDKTPKSNYPVDTVLLPLLETHTAKNFKDEYANIPLDISKMVWVATANDIDAISAPIKSRFQVFNIPSPTFEERLILAQAIYSTLLKDNVWGAKFEKKLDQAVLMELARDKNSSRDLRKTILDACGRAAKRKDNKLTLNDLNIVQTNKEISPWDKKHD